MAKNMKIVALLTAVDNMSGVIDRAMGKSEQRIGKFASLLKSGAMLEAGRQGFQTLLGDPSRTFGQFEQASAFLKANLMNSNGVLDPMLWKKVNQEAVRLGNLFPGNTADFYSMFNEMKRLGVEAESIYTGAGEAAARLALVTGESYETTAILTGKIANALGIQGTQLLDFFDIVARGRNVGATLTDMEYAFGRSAGQLKFLGLQGVEQGKKVAAFYATLIRMGLSGMTVGTNVSRLLTEMMNPKKYAAMQAAAKQFGITMDLLDKKGNFLGIDNMVQQFDKLQGLTTGQINEIFKSLTGESGLDDQIAKFFSKGGAQYYEETMRLMNQQASMMDKSNLMLDTQVNKWDAVEGSWENVKASFGEVLAPTLKSLLDYTNSILGKMQALVQENPRMFKLIGATIAFGSSMLMLGGGLRMLGLVKNAIWGINGAMLANPAGQFAALLLAAGTLVYMYWDDLNAAADRFANRILFNIKEVEKAIDILGTTIKSTFDPFNAGKYSAELVGRQIERSKFQLGVENLDAKQREGIKRPMPKAGNDQFVYSPNITVNGNANSEQANSMLEQQKKMMEAFVKEIQQKKARLGFN